MIVKKNSLYFSLILDYFCKLFLFYIYDLCLFILMQTRNCISIVVG